MVAPAHRAGLGTNDHLAPDRNYWRNQQKHPADGRGDL
jgi:hypothetical protein